MLLSNAARLLGSRRNIMMFTKSSNGNGLNGACFTSSKAASERSAAASESWEQVLDILSSLIKNKTRADGKSWRDAHENMPVYLKVGLLLQLVGVWGLPDAAHSSHNHLSCSAWAWKRVSKS